MHKGEDRLRREEEEREEVRIHGQSGGDDETDPGEQVVPPQSEPEEVQREGSQQQQQSIVSRLLGVTDAKGRDGHQESAYQPFSRAQKRFAQYIRRGDGQQTEED